MKRLLAAMALVPATAFGQAPAPDQSGSLPPVQQQWEQQGQAPTPSLNAPSPPDVLGGSQEDPGGQAQGGQALVPPTGNTGPATFSRPNVWLPTTGAKIQALDKVNARAKDFTLKVGQSATFGSLTITVKACMVRPADQPADAAAFLDVTDSHPDSGNFAGWMLENEPSVSMMQNPIYDVRVDGCT